MRGDPYNRPVQVIDYDDGKPAQTYWRLLRKVEDIAGMPATRLALRPVTGRTHQLRVHCLAMGHPIVGDRLYNPASRRVARMMLHAEQLAFVHPVTRERLCLVAEAEF